MNPDECYRLADGVAIRRERFGGLAYHYHRRRLYFIHGQDLAALVGELTGTEPLGDTVETFGRSRGLPRAAVQQLLKSCATLAESGLVVRADDASADPRDEPGGHGG